MLTPFVDFFRRGEVSREVRLLAASGALAPRAHEQMALLILLVDDQDAEIQQTAERTLSAIPEEALKKFLARSDVPLDMREFFADRGIFPAEMPALTVDEPLIETEEESEPSAVAATRDTTGEQDPQIEGEPEEERDSLIQQLAKMTFPERLKAAVKGSRELRSILIRDPNKMVAAAVLSGPKVSEPEIEAFAKMANVSEEVLRIIASNRNWMKNYAIASGLTRNPKTPVGLSLNLLSRLNIRDIGLVAADRNVPEVLRSAARRKVAASKD